MDSGKDFFFRSHFSLFQPQNLAVFGGHGQFSGNPVPQVGFAGNPVLLRNALIEPQILQSKCSEQLCRILGSSQLEPRIRKFGQMVSEVKLNCVFQGLKMAKKCLFKIFHGVKTYKKYILQKKWSKNLIPAPGNGESNLPPLI